MIWSHLLTGILLLAIGACAGPKKDPELQAITYSEETLKTFEEIEREQVLEYYRQLREREMGTKTRAAPPPPTPQKLQNFHTARPRPPAPQKPAAPKSNAISADPEELRKEIEQNLVFFCMRQRNNTRFKNEGSCETFTSQIQEQCSEQFEFNDRRLFNCVRNRLK